jgi:hypothetical protein
MCAAANDLRADDARDAATREGTSHAARIVMLHRMHYVSRARIVTVATAVALLGCAGASAPRTPAAPALTATSAATVSSASEKAASTEITANAVTECDLVCERAQIVPRPADGPDYNAKATANANAVLEGMHDDLLACYKKRVSVNPNAHGFITVDIVIDGEGRVRNVDTTGGAILGAGTMSCIVHRIERGSFERPHGGGTLHIHVPFSLRRVAPGEET